MAMNEENTKIPRKAIKGAAGINDKFSVEVIDTATYFKNMKEEKGPYNVVSNKYKREILSTDLMQGVTIKAVTTQNKERALKEAKENEITKE